MFPKGIKRESGANPERSRHCKRERTRILPLKLSFEKAADVMNLSQETCALSKCQNAVAVNQRMDNRWPSGCQVKEIQAAAGLLFSCLVRILVRVPGREIHNIDSTGESLHDAVHIG